MKSKLPGQTKDPNPNAEITGEVQCTEYNKFTMSIAIIVGAVIGTGVRALAFIDSGTEFRLR